MQFKANTNIGNSNISKYGGSVASKGATLSFLDDTGGGGSSNSNSGNTNTDTGYDNYMASVEEIDYSNPPTESTSTSPSTSNSGKPNLPPPPKGKATNAVEVNLSDGTEFETMSPSEAQSQMEANSKAWWDAKAAGNQAEMDRLHAENERLSQIASPGSTFSKDGTWSNNGQKLYQVDKPNNIPVNESTSDDIVNETETDLPNINKGKKNNQEGIIQYTDTGTGNASSSVSTSIANDTGTSGKSNLPPPPKGKATNAVEVNLSDGTEFDNNVPSSEKTDTSDYSEIYKYAQNSWDEATLDSIRESFSPSMEVSALLTMAGTGQILYLGNGLFVETKEYIEKTLKGETDYQIRDINMYALSPSERANALMVSNNGDVWKTNTLNQLSDPLTSSDVNKALAVANGLILDLPTDKGEMTRDAFKRTGATLASGTLSFLKGVLDFGEAVSDAMTIAGGAIGTVFTGAYDIGKGVATGDWDFSTTKALWDDTINPAVKHNDVEYVDETLGWRQDLDDISLIKSDGVASKVLEGIGYIAPIIALTAATAGTATPLLTVGGTGGTGLFTAGAAAANVTGAVATVSSSSLVAGGIAAVAGIGRNAAEAWNDGASTGEGLLYGGLKGTFEGLQMLGGYVVNGLTVFSGAGIAPQIGNTLTHVALDTIDGGFGPIADTTFSLLYSPNEQNMDAIMHSVNYDKDGNKINDLTWDELSGKQKWDAMFEYNGGWRSVGIQAAAAGVVSFLSEIPDIVATNNASNVMKNVNANGMTSETLSEMHDLTGNTLKSFLDQADEAGKLSYVVHNLTTDQLKQTFSLLDKPTLKSVMDNLEDSQLKALVKEEADLFLTENGKALLEDGVFSYRVASSQLSDDSLKLVEILNSSDSNIYKDPNFYMLLNKVDESSIKEIIPFIKDSDIVDLYGNINNYPKLQQTIISNISDNQLVKLFNGVDGFDRLRIMDDISVDRLHSVFGDLDLNFGDVFFGSSAVAKLVVASDSLENASKIFVDSGFEFKDLFTDVFYCAQRNPGVNFNIQNFAMNLPKNVISDNSTFLYDAFNYYNYDLNSISKSIDWKKVIKTKLTNGKQISDIINSGILKYPDDVVVTELIESLPFDDSLAIIKALDLSQLKSVGNNLEGVLKNKLAVGSNISSLYDQRIADFVDFANVKMIDYFRNIFGLSDDTLKKLNNSYRYLPHERFEVLRSQRKVTPRAMAFNDGEYSIMNLKYGDKLITDNIVHESLHQLSANGNKFGFSVNNKFKGVTECTTEYLAQLCRGISECGYNDGVLRLKKLVDGGVFNEDDLIKAYFNNDFDYFRNALINVSDVSTVDKLISYFDEFISDDIEISKSALNELDKIISQILINMN